MMAPREIRRPFKRPAISDQQKRRELSLLRQEQHRRDAQYRARFLASSVLSLQSPAAAAADDDENDPEAASHDIQLETVPDPQVDSLHASEGFDVRHASKLRGPEARRWFAKQLMLPEWMIDVPDGLSHHWCVFARPSGKRCFVVSSDGVTVSRLRNGSILHHFPSALPNGARTRDRASSAQAYSILDCIFHELDQTYYVIDMVCWRGYSLYDCTAEFRFFWLNSKLAETGAFDPPSQYHKYRFSLVPMYNCDHSGLHTAYTSAVPYVKDGLLFYDKQAHYQTGSTPLTLVWKDEACSQYVLDTDSKGQVPTQQQVVLELQDDWTLTTSDDPPIVFGFFERDFTQKSGLHSGSLLRFALREGGLILADGKIEKADLQYLGTVNRARAIADTFSKVLFQYQVRHSPLRIDDLLASIGVKEICDAEMIG